MVQHMCTLQPLAPPSASRPRVNADAHAGDVVEEPFVREALERVDVEAKRQREVLELAGDAREFERAHASCQGEVDVGRRTGGALHAAPKEHGGLDARVPRKHIAQVARDARVEVRAHGLTARATSHANVTRAAATRAR